MLDCAAFTILKKPMIRTVCPDCETEYRVQAEFAGRKAKCPKCEAVFSIPKTEMAPEEELVIAGSIAEVPEGDDAFVPIPDWVQKPSFPIEAGLKEA